MKRTVFCGCLMLVATSSACTAHTPKVTARKPNATVSPAKRTALPSLHPARYVLVETVGASYDETGAASPVRTHDPAIVEGKRFVLDGGMILESAPAPESLLGFRSLPPRLGGGYVFWSDEHTYHAPTFLGKLTPFVKMGARGGVRPWFESFVLRTEIGPLEVTPSTFAVRRSELARFSEMLSLDGQLGIRTDPVGRMEASVDGGKTFRSFDPQEIAKYLGPTAGPGNTLLFVRDFSNDWSGMRSDRQAVEMRVLGPSGTLIPFDPKAKLPQRLEPPSWATVQEEPAYSRRFAPPELGLAAATGALIPGEQIAVLRESTLRVLSARTGALIQDLPLALGSQEFGHCQPVTLGESVFLACTHSTGAHVYALRGTPTTAQLEATFPETGEFVAGLGERFLYVGRCGSTPPTVRDFLGYGLSYETAPPTDPDPNAAPSEPPPPPDEPPEKPAHEAAVCVRLADGTWLERRIEGLGDRQKTKFLPDDNGRVTVVVFDKPDPEKPAPTLPEGVRLLRVDARATKFDATSFFQASEPSEPRMRTVARDVWLDEKDGSVHGWEIPKSEESEEPDEHAEAREGEATGMIGLVARGTIVGVQIKSDGTVTRHSVPDGVINVVVGGPHALATARTDDGPTYFESTDGGRSYAPVVAPFPGNFLESSGGDIEGCSVIGCSLGGGLVRLGWGSDKLASTPKEAQEDKSDDFEALTSKLFDPQTLIPPSPHKQLHCRLEGKDSSAPVDADKPFAVTLAMSDDTNVGAAVDRKWTALATTPFDLKPAHRVLFEDVDVDALKGGAIPVLRSTATNPLGFFLRTREFRFDLTPGAKRKPVSMPPDARGDVAAEIDGETFVLFDKRLGDVQLVRGGAVRSLFRINEVADVNRAHLTLARRAGAGADTLSIAILQEGSGDILLSDLDLAKGMLGPLRLVGNLRQLDVGSACVHGPRDYRLVRDEHLIVHVEPDEEGRGGLFGSSLLTVGSGNACLEASEMRLVNESTLVVRYSGPGPGGHPALLHDHGKALRATCAYE